MNLLLKAELYIKSIYEGAFDIMMYLHFCKNCNKIFILNGHQQDCGKCGEAIAELKLPFMDYCNYSAERREELISSLQEPAELTRQTRNYRFARHTKRYKERMMQKGTSN